MAFSDILDTTYSPTLRDWCQLGARIFVGDGVNSNLALDGNPGHDRIMGCWPQQGTMKVELAAGEALRGNAVYVWGVRRTVKLGALEIESAVVYASVTTGWYGLVCGAAGEDDPVVWAAVADGAFAIEVDGESVAVAGCDFSGCATMAAVAAVVQVALRAETGGEETVVWDEGHFEFGGGDGPWGYMAAPVAGTDLSSDLWMTGLEADGATPTGDGNGEVTLDRYEFLPADPETVRDWTVEYRVYRSKPESATALYLVATLSEDDYDELDPAGVYEDDTPDDGLPAAATVNLNEDETNVFLPPVRYLRAWKGRILAGGSYVYTLGLATVEEGALTTVIVASPGEVRETDIGAFLQVAGEDQVFMVTDVDAAAGTWTVDKAFSGPVADAQLQLWRDGDTAYVCNVLPGNIEAYTEGNTIYANAGANNRLQGIAVNGGIAYLLRRHTVEIIESDGDVLSVVQHPDSPPGAVSHATIADRYAPAVIWYAGGAGVWVGRGTSAKLVSGPVQKILEDDVAHSQDAWTHAVYDPNTGLYYLWLFGRDWQEYGVRVPQLVLVYDLRRDQWYGPWELAASESELYRDRYGRLVPVIGVGGGVAQLEFGYYDGAGDAGTVAAATDTTLTDTAAAFPVEDNGLAGFPVHVTRPATGATQRRIVALNTATTLSIFGAWAWELEAGDVYQVGSIRWEAEFRDLDTGDGGGDWDVIKKAWRLAVGFEKDTATNQMTVGVAGGGNRGARAHEKVVNMGVDEIAQVQGAELGVRSRTLTVTLSGAGVRPVKVTGLSYGTVETKR
jgi:hypothetical protein